MTQQDFERIVEEQLNTARDLLIIKGREYSLSEDRLEVFKKAAVLQGENVKQALCGMLAKHVVSIYDMSMSRNEFTEARWTEKITDSINYLLLLKAAVMEESHEDERH
jgi:hypothetical protein